MKVELNDKDKKELFDRLFNELRKDFREQITIREIIRQELGSLMPKK